MYPDHHNCCQKGNNWLVSKVPYLSVYFLIHYIILQHRSNTLGPCDRYNFFFNTEAEKYLTT